MIVLGVDPGLATIGWGVIEAERGRQRLVDYGCILTTPQQSFPDRLCQIGRDMRALLSQYRPEEIAFEELGSQARALGADAVVGIDIDYETVGQNGSMLMVTASGTAVYLE